LEAICIWKDNIMTATKARATKVLIVDDHVRVRLALSAFVRAATNLELAGEATNGIEALEACAKYQPDVVLMDLVMPQMDGITATRLIRQTFPGVKVIILTGFGKDDLVDMAMKSGASCYLNKDIPASDLANTITATRCQ
jgi:NarL family two-component system response regulator LiaR